MLRSSPLHTAIKANLAVIQQGVNLIGKLDRDSYGRKVPLCYNASIGGHIRHIIEHYQAFIRGLDDGEIDYEKRFRDPLVENDPEYAGGLLEAIAQQLEELAGTLTNGTIHYCAETTEGIASATSVLRELEFLLSHTVHHYALVAVMARVQGHEPEPTFGVAPSTLKYQRSLAVATQSNAVPALETKPLKGGARCPQRAAVLSRERLGDKPLHLQLHRYDFDACAR